MSLIEKKIEGQLEFISLNNSEKRNALSREMIQQLTAAFKESTGRLVVLSGNGPSFCAGADLNYMKSMRDYSKAENVADSLELSSLFKTIANHRVPVIARVHGHAFGGALGLLAACDLIMAHAETKFCFSEVKLGLAPAVISPYAFVRMGYTEARRYFLTGEVFKADVARSTGLINEVYADEKQAEEMLTSWQESLLAGGPIAQSKIKGLTNQLAQLEQHEQYLAELIAELRVSAEGQKGIAAFFDKKKPQW